MRDMHAPEAAMPAAAGGSCAAGADTPGEETAAVGGDPTVAVASQQIPEGKDTADVADDAAADAVAPRAAPVLSRAMLPSQAASQEALSQAASQKSRKGSVATGASHSKWLCQMVVVVALPHTHVITGADQVASSCMTRARRFRAPAAAAAAAACRAVRE